MLLNKLFPISDPLGPLGRDTLAEPLPETVLAIAYNDHKAAVALHKFVDLTFDRFRLGFAEARQD